MNVWPFQNCEAIQGIQEMEGMRISDLDNFAKGFWGPSSHLVEYSYLDHLSDHSSQTDLSFRRNGISKREGGEEEGKRRWKSKGYMFHFIEKVRQKGQGSAQGTWGGITPEDRKQGSGVQRSLPGGWVRSGLGDPC